ncbi:MAG: DUF1631 family protein [Burkholderiaceae bacterium]
MSPAPTPFATLFERYLAQCTTDASAALERICREAGAPPPGGHAFVAPAQRQARQVLAGLARSWVAHLAQPAGPVPPPTQPANPFVASGFGVPTGLSLMSDDDVDEDIESTRLVQAVEAAAEWSLRDLRSRLASAPPAPGAPRDEVLPLSPARVVGALCATLHDEPIEPPVRLAVLRTVAEPLAQGLARVYEAHAELLADWGLQPARYTIRRDPVPEPGAGAAARAVAVAEDRIPALLAQVSDQAGLSPGMQGLMARLAGPVARSIAADGRLLESMDNPLWRLVDRLAALGQLDTAPSPGAFQLPLHLRLEPIVAALEQAAQPMPAERYAQALAAAEVEAMGVAGHTRPMAGDDATVPMPLGPSGPVTAAPAPVVFSEPALAAEERRRELEPVVRAQMAARLRDAPVLPAIRQFLLGPWLGVVLHSLVEHGEDSPATQRVLNTVEALAKAGGTELRAPVSRAELDCLRMDAEDGLAAAGHLPAGHARQHVLDLVAALSAWPRPREAADTSVESTLSGGADSAVDAFDAIVAAEAGDAPERWPSHDELATVPIALDAHNPDERSLRDCEAWLDSLAVGDICRVQRQGQWATLRLNWRSDNGHFFAFGNSAGLAFCASRRVLGRMRLEGLATTMARGQWVQRAVETLPMPLDG